jgi:tetratricopeptide (TPR) repeat protein
MVAAGWTAGVATAEALRTDDVPSPLVCHKLAKETQLLEARKGDESFLLQFVERALETGDREVVEELAACYKWLGDQYRDRGSYRAEELYLKAVELAPTHPEVLEGIAQYYRNYRGSKGLFAEAEYYYLRAEDALVEALQKVEDPVDQDYLLGVREKVIRGRIELNKREGLGLVVPHDQDRRFGVYLGFDREAGDFPVSHNDLATPALGLLGIDREFDSRQMIRSQSLERQRTRLRIRQGKHPYWDLAWSSVEGGNVIAGQFLPVTFFDIDIEELEVAIEDTVGKAPYGDLLWRVEVRRGFFDVIDLYREESERLNASITMTRSFGRFKTDLELVGSAASVDTDGRSDSDLLAAVNLRMLHFRPHAMTNPRAIDPRGYEYVAGYTLVQDSV